MRRMKAISRNVSNFEEKLANLEAVLDQIKSAETDIKVSQQIYLTSHIKHSHLDP